MTLTSTPPIASRSRRATESILDLVIRDGAPLVIVDSPPGAGKTALVEMVAVAAQHCSLRVAIAAPRVEQTFDIVRRLLQDYPTIPVDLWLAKDRELPVDLAQHSDAVHPGQPSWRNINSGARVVVGTVKMFAAHAPRLQPEAFDLLITDEAYQVTYAGIAPLLHLAKQALLVGDPGQLPPLVRANPARFEAAQYKVHWASPRELLRRFPEVPTVKLPATRRLPQDTVEFVQPAFYHDLPFRSAVNSLDRCLAFTTAGFRDPVDNALDMLAAGETLVAIMLPKLENAVGPVDEELAVFMASVASRLLARGASWKGKSGLSPKDIGCIDPHVASGARVRHGLREQGLSGNEMMVDTPEIWQGLERPVIVAKHPLSGLRHLDSFSLESGRWCVSLSRHLLGCLVVGRDGIGDSLESHSHDTSDRPMGAADAEWAGWQAHHDLWTHLEDRGRVVRV